jgi:hypothetical protein
MVLSLDIQSGKFWPVASTGAKKNGTGFKSRPCCSTGTDVDGLGSIEAEEEVSELLGETSAALSPVEHELIIAATKTIDVIRNVVIVEMIGHLAQKPTGFERSLTYVMLVYWVLFTWNLGV